MAQTPADQTTSISAEFPFDSRYLEVEGSRLHYVEEGSGDPILFLHGNPTWSYLWRNVLPHLSPHGRALALDLIGMGRSDKPDIEYRFFDHVRYLEGFIKKLQLENLTLVLHDWGAALGFHYAMRHQERVKGIAFLEPAGLWVVPSWDIYSEAKRRLFQSYRDPERGWDLLVNQNDFGGEPPPRRHHAIPDASGDGSVPAAFSGSLLPETRLAMAQRDSHRKQAGGRGPSGPRLQRTSPTVETSLTSLVRFSRKNRQPEGVGNGVGPI